MKHFRIAELIFNTPLCIAERRLETILSVLGPHLNGNVDPRKPLDVDDEIPPNVEETEPVATNILVIPVMGSLMNRSFGLQALSGISSYQTIREQIRLGLEDPNVNGLLFDFDSAGGEANGMIDLAVAIKQASEQKPTMAMVDESAYSAAYGLASGAQEIIVPRTGGVGSIGTIAIHVDQSQFDKNIGVKYTFVKAGEFKDDFNAHSSLSSGEQERLQNMVNQINSIFIQTVADHRNLSAETVVGMKAGIFLGQEALEAKLVDAVMSREEAIGSFIERVKSQQSTQVQSTGILNQDEGDVNMENKGTTTIVQPQSTPQPVTVPESVASGITKEEVKAIEDGATARASTIVNICTLAGKPSLATEYISSGVSPQQVTKALLDKNAEEDEAKQIASQLDQPKESLPSSKTEVEPVGAVMDRWKTQMSA